MEQDGDLDLRISGAVRRRCPPSLEHQYLSSNERAISPIQYDRFASCTVDSRYKTSIIVILLSSHHRCEFGVVWRASELI